MQLINLDGAFGEVCRKTMETWCWTIHCRATIQSGWEGMLGLGYGISVLMVCLVYLLLLLQARKRPMGCPTGLGVISPRGLVGGPCPCGRFKMLKWLSALIFVFNFQINI